MSAGHRSTSLTRRAIDGVLQGYCPPGKRKAVRSLLEDMISVRPLDIGESSRTLGMSYHEFYSLLGRVLTVLGEDGFWDDTIPTENKTLSKGLTSIPGSKPSESTNNEVKASQPKKSPMLPLPANTDDALWAMQVWSERSARPELQEYGGKFVAVYDRHVILSGNDPLEIQRKAAEQCGVPEDLIAIDFWEE